MKLLIDANVLLDVLLAREPHVQASALIWKLCESKAATGCVSALSFANLVYVMRKSLTPKQIEDLHKLLSLIFSFEDLGAGDISKAASLKWQDFEDALQSVTASRIHADYIVTRNVKDFAGSIVPAITPTKLLAL